MHNVIGGSILIFGDLHFSDVFTGQHKGYLANCFRVLAQMDDIIQEVKPKGIVLLGDLVGWNETNVRNREVLSTLCKFLRKWNMGAKVFAVRGNHDMKGYPEFNFLADLGLITTSSACGGHFDYLGYEGQEIPEVRFHIVDYKQEDNALDMLGMGESNVVLAHNNFTIAGVTNWYNEHDGIELGLQANFGEVDMVISGHIHNPSPEIVSATMPSGKSCQLIYPGCPTRPIRDKNMYETCHVVKITYNESLNSTDIDTITMDLLPSKELFYEADSFIEEKTEEELAEEIRVEALKDILGDLMKYRMNQGDILTQLDNIPNASEEAKQVAKNYMMQALNMGGK